jgi:hypothetical protein
VPGVGRPNPGKPGAGTVQGQVHEGRQVGDLGEFEADLLCQSITYMAHGSRVRIVVTLDFSKQLDHEIRK